jgi:hypothetical protein
MKASLQSWSSLFQEMKERVIERRKTYCMAVGRVQYSMLRCLVQTRLDPVISKHRPRAKINATKGKKKRGESLKVLCIGTTIVELTTVVLVALKQQHLSLSNALAGRGFP